MFLALIKFKVIKVLSGQKIFLEKVVSLYGNSKIFNLFAISLRTH